MTTQGCDRSAVSVIKTSATSKINGFGIPPKRVIRLLSSIGVMVTFVLAMLAYVQAFLMARYRLAMETTALRQQLAVYKRKQPRPKLRQSHRLFWVALGTVWNKWSEAVILVKPDTVVSWHRAGYRLFWTW